MHIFMNIAGLRKLLSYKGHSQGHGSGNLGVLRPLANRLNLGTLLDEWFHLKGNAIIFSLV